MISKANQAGYKQPGTLFLADNRFGSKNNMELIQYETDKKFILGMKSNRPIAFSKRESKKGSVLQSGIASSQGRRKKDSVA